MTILFLLLLLLESSSLLVGDAVKVDEQQKIRTQESTTENGRGLCTGTAAHVGHMGPVSGGKVGISTEIDDKEINDELGDLKGGQVLLPPNLGTSSGAEIVVVHQDMDGQVEYNGDPRLETERLIKLFRSPKARLYCCINTYHRGLSVKLSEAKNHSQRMMIVVEEF